MKKILTFILVFTLFMGSTSIVSFAQTTNQDVFVSGTALSQDEMTQIFSQGYTKIIAYNNGSNDYDTSRQLESVSAGSETMLSGTYSVTTCTAMKKRSYDWVGYSKNCFQETYTSVSAASSTFTLSLGIWGVGISFPVQNMNKATSGSYSLTSADKDLVVNHSHYSCLRMRGYLTWAKYTSKIYDNYTGDLVTTTSYEHTYTYRSNHGSGFDYYLVARSLSACTDIKNRSYVGTASEISSMATWRTVSNPATASISPWL